MTEQKIEVRKPLFDRLVDNDPVTGPFAGTGQPRRHEERPLRTLGRRELKDSVCRELQHLLNTRAPLPVHRLRGRERTVLEYGVPDFSRYSARSHDDRLQLAEQIRAAIAAYEPRLTDVRVRLEPAPGNDAVLTGSIEASLIVDSVAAPVAFVTLLQVGDGGMEVFDAG